VVVVEVEVVKSIVETVTLQNGQQVNYPLGLITLRAPKTSKRAVDRNISDILGWASSEI